MVLLAGDLFHDNKPSRRTLHKTMNILRRYTMGPNPISFQIISNQKQNFRSTLDPYNTVNYENPFVSIDLPIFSIHGNHDDPTRDGGDEMLAALDLLAMGSLVNYFGRQDEVDKIQVNPILIKKGDTKVALYGMGSMRDERLNRMWQGKKVRFLKPEVEEEDGEDDDSGWFNIFALHQNRDFGRGSKNCVHESMIPGT
jgi:double-strand break repair protein MRE11